MKFELLNHITSTMALKAPGTTSQVLILCLVVKDVHFSWFSSSFYMGSAWPEVSHFMGISQSIKKKNYTKPEDSFSWRQKATQSLPASVSFKNKGNP